MQRSPRPPARESEDFGTDPSPEGRGCREAAGEGYREIFLYPSPGPSGHPLPSGEGFARNTLFLLPLCRTLLKNACDRLPNCSNRSRKIGKFLPTYPKKTNAACC